MVYKIKSATKHLYKENLSKFICSRIIVDKRKVIFIDCMNYISQYMFKRKHIERIMEGLSIARIEQIHDLLDMLKSIQFNTYFRKSQVMIISSFNHLLEDRGEREADYFRKNISKILLRLEARYSKEIVIMELYKRWVTQYRLSV
jgi:hypothetical protein